MKQTITLKCLLAVTFIALLFGCGGGGGGGSSAPVPPFTLTVAVAGIPGGKQLGTLKATLTLPAALSFRTTASGEVLSGQIVPLGTGTVLGNYHVATGKLEISLISPSTAIAAGDCLTIFPDKTGGAVITAADVSVSVDEAKDFSDGSTLAGITAVVK